MKERSLKDKTDIKQVIMNILITGGTGFIGTQLVNHLLKEGHKIIVLIHNKKPSTNDSARYISNFNELNHTENIDVIINLAGAPISKKWTKKYTKTLLHNIFHHRFFFRTHPLTVAHDDARLHVLSHSSLEEFRRLQHYY